MSRISPQLPLHLPWISRGIFFVAGCLATTAFAPLEWRWVLPVLLFLWCYLCLTTSPRAAARHGFWFGFGWFLTGTYWIYISVVVFGQAPIWIALVLMLGLVLIMAGYIALTSWTASRLAAAQPWRLLAVAPAAWVLIEWLRGWVLTGFPWLALGYSQIDTMLAGWAPVAGVYGVSYVFVTSVAALLVATAVRGRARWLALGIAVLPWAAGSALRSVDWTTPIYEPVRATLIQGGIGQDVKWLPEQFGPTLSFYREASLRARGSDIVVWPEVAIPAVTDRVENYILGIETDAEQNGQTILFGILERVYDEQDAVSIYNSVIAVGAGVRQAYRKRHLVPFGEYFPVPDAVREWMRMLSLPHSDLAAGAPVQPLIVTARGVKLAVAICYEDAYAAEQLYALPSANLLVNVSNDAWFGDSIAPHQHLEIARMRSLEAGRAAIRATNTGISAFISHDGMLEKTGPQFRPVTMTTTLHARSGTTPYAKLGNWPVVGWAGLLLGLAVLRGAEPRSARATSTG